MNAQKLTAATLKLSLALLLALTAATGAIWGWAVALGVVVGGVLMILNFLLLQWTVEKYLGGTKGGAGGFLLVFFLKFAVLAAVLSLALWTGKVDILGLFLGCSVVVLAVMALAPILGVLGLNEDGQNGERN